ncbi:hypothetical protein IC235_16480 [Hymenobacter sp. BT664]|uniref:Tail specific protease domain-containing protein n=1 Tax=Hymenobacter montanus TaxID=2771359 RepID=A0A927BFI9_9BACT|nr:S41 family peptidase [Hymenobacter montanus]MBD2769486.1 hypothetical protein [Hymenobacter montanus]
MKQTFVTLLLLVNAAPQVTAQGQSNSPVIAPSKVSAHPVDRQPTGLTPGQQYLLTAIRLLKQKSLYTSRINWPELEAKYLLKAKEADQPNDVYGFITEIIKSNNLRHHSFSNPEQVRAYKGKARSTDTIEKAKVEMPQGKILSKKVGYLKIPQCLTSDSLVLLQYATELQRIIAALSQKKVQGWVVDLRDNDGGNMWPMLAGLGPLLGEGAVGSFVTPATSKTTPWYYAQGEAFPKGRVVAVRVSTTPAKTLPHARVTVLVNENTASAAEAVTVAFIGKENTTIIGQKTGGYSTANSEYELSDGAKLYVSTAVYADRHGKQYDNGIIPDIVTAKEATLAKAVDWLLSQPK